MSLIVGLEPIIARFRAKPAPTPAVPPPARATVKAVAPEVLFASIAILLSFVASFLLLPQPISSEFSIRTRALLSITFTAAAAPTPVVPAPPMEITAPKAAADEIAFTITLLLPEALPVPVNSTSESLICEVTERSNQLKLKPGATAVVPEPERVTTNENMPFFTLKSASVGSTLSKSAFESLSFNAPSKSASLI